MKFFGRSKRCASTALLFLITFQPISSSQFQTIYAYHNYVISKLEFPTLWKVARISPIPKVGKPQANGYFRPVSDLSVLSKVYERLSLRQMVDFLARTASLQPNVSACPKGHLTKATLFAIRDRSYPQGDEQRWDHHRDNSRLFKRFWDSCVWNSSVQIA